MYAILPERAVDTIWPYNAIVHLDRIWRPHASPQCCPNSNRPVKMDLQYNRPLEKRWTRRILVRSGRTIQSYFSRCRNSLPATSLSMKLESIEKLGQTNDIKDMREYMRRDGIYWESKIKSDRENVTRRKSLWREDARAKFERLRAARRKFLGARLAFEDRKCNNRREIKLINDEIVSVRRAWPWINQR